jgi:hypothetical protein
VFSSMAPLILRVFTEDEARAKSIMVYLSMVLQELGAFRDKGSEFFDSRRELTTRTLPH